MKDYNLSVFQWAGKRDSEEFSLRDEITSRRVGDIFEEDLAHLCSAAPLMYVCLGALVKELAPREKELPVNLGRIYFASKEALHKAEGDIHPDEDKCFGITESQREELCDLLKELFRQTGHYHGPLGSCPACRIEEALSFLKGLPD